MIVARSRSRSSSSSCFALSPLVAVVDVAAARARCADRPNEGEYYALLLASASACSSWPSAANLLMAYLSLELVSLTSYVLTGFLRHNRRSGEAALKYLIYGGVASGAMIYGMSWIFGLAGSDGLRRRSTRRCAHGDRRAAARCSSRWC